MQWPYRLHPLFELNSESFLTGLPKRAHSFAARRENRNLFSRYILPILGRQLNRYFWGGLGGSLSQVTG